MTTYFHRLRRYGNLLILVTFVLLAHRLTSQSSSADTKDDLNIHVSVNLVQIDASVTDSHGQPVGNLTKSDFELLLDGKPQQITRFSQIQQPAENSPEKAGMQQKASDRPQLHLKSGQVARVVVLFVDDVSLSAQTVPQVRRGVQKTIQNQLRSGDLVAIVRASAGLGALQDFTSDSRMLLAAADQIRWNPAGRGQMTSYDEVGVDKAAEIRRLGLSSDAVFGFQEDENYREQAFAVATLDSLRSVIHGMAGMPGRKSLILLSDRLPVSLREITQGPKQGRSPTQLTGDGPIFRRMHDCIDQAARNGVVIYAVDTRGLSTLTMGAGDTIIDGLGAKANLPATGGNLETAVPSPRAGSAGSGSASGGAASAATAPGDFVWSTTEDRRESHDHRQAGGWLLASQTGGLMIPESNDIAASIARIYADMGSYYLIGFSPPDETFNPGANGQPLFRRITVRVKRPGVQVRSRSGFYGALDDKPSLPQDRAELRLASSLESPFGSSAVDLRLRSSFLNARNNEWLAAVNLWVDARNLTLDGPAINRSGIIHLLVRAFGVNGAQLDGGIDKILRVRLNEEGYQRALLNGLVYSTTIVVNKPGPYQIRAALLDQATGKIGTANQFLAIPAPGKRQVALSGIVFTGMMSKEDDITPAHEPITFTPGQQIPFAFQIMGDSKGKTFSAATLLYRDGDLIVKSEPQRVDTLKQMLHGSIFAKLNVTIPASALPGHYQMQVILSDTSSQSVTKIASQWTEFDVGDSIKPSIR